METSAAIYVRRSALDDREDNRGGSRITKNHKGSTRKIDAAVASLIAHHRAAVWREVEAPAEPQLLVL